MRYNKFFNDRPCNRPDNHNNKRKMRADLNFEEYLFEQRRVALTGNRSVSLLAEFGIIALTTAVLLRSFELKAVMAWVALAVIASVYSWRSHSGGENLATQKQRQSYLNNVVFGTWLVATTWGLVPVLFFAPDDTAAFILLICLYAGFVSGALAVTLAYSRSFIAFALGISIPFGARMIYQGDDVYLMVCGLIIFYIVMLTYVSFNLQKLFENNARSAYQNLALIGQLKEEKEIAVRAIAAKSQFLAAASHDLRQPIHAANLFLSILQPMQVGEKSLQVLEKLKQSMQGLNKMLHGLLDISKLDASAVDNQPEHTSLNRIIDGLIDEQHAALNRVEVINRLPQNQFIFADPVLVERILRNVLDNAIKYTPQGVIEFSGSQTGPEVSVTISDTGIGIPHDQLENIFDEFVQLNNPERDRQKGLGLGLAIVKRLCELAGLKIALDSTPGYGTQVTLTMPRGDHAKESEQPEQDRNLTGLRVLVVDDEQDILLAMSTLLEQWGCEVLTASNQMSADLQIEAKQFVPQLLIADFRLREQESGIDIIHHYQRRFGAQLLAILMTGDTAPERVQQARASGATVMYKPVDGDSLKAEIQSMLLAQAA